MYIYKICVHNFVVVGNSNAGMTHMIGDRWLSLFDVVIINARKPDFFYITKKVSNYFFTFKMLHCYVFDVKI